jgi:hypothetical protein
MREYDRSQPLIFIHIPKAAGTTSRRLFEAWYGTHFLSHYFDERTGRMPPKYDLCRMHSVEKPIVLYGHFNKLRNFGIEDRYPEVKQFITIIRDPFEVALSRYFYVRKVGSNWKDRSLIPAEKLTDYVINSKSTMLNHFPREVTNSNYKEIIEEYFIEIGITEYLHESMKRIAGKLKLPFDATLIGHRNATERDQEVSVHLKDIFIENNQLEFKVYAFALQRFNRQGAAPAGNSTACRSRG